MATIKAEKKALRTRMKETLASLDSQNVLTQSTRAQEAVLTLSEYKTAKGLSIYLSMPMGEASTDMLVRDALQAGKAVFVPYMYKTPEAGKIMDMLRLHSLEDYESLVKDNWGIPTLPQPGLEQRMNALGGQGLTRSTADSVSRHDGQLDMIVMPAVAFDHKMQRLGHGAGYYDSFLSRYHAGSALKKPLLGALPTRHALMFLSHSLIIAVGLCLAEQILTPSQSIPVTELDWRVNMVVSGDGCILEADDP